MTPVEHDALVASFAELKEISDPEALAAASLSIVNRGGSLVPLCRLHAADAEIIDTLARWRIRNMAVYPTQFTVTTKGTASWLRDQVLGVPQRILFLITDRDGTLIGTVGFADASAADRSVRLESLMRGTDHGPPGVMGAAVSRLLRWGRATVGIELVWAKVFSDNARVISLLHRHGFVDEGLTPLRALTNGGRVEFVPTDRTHAERFHLRMSLPLGPPAAVQAEGGQL